MTLSSIPDRQPLDRLSPEQQDAVPLVPAPLSGEHEPDGVLVGLDVAVAVAHLGVGVVTSAVGGLARRLGPLGGFLGHPPLVPDRFAPATVLSELVADLTTRGRADLVAARRLVEELVRDTTPHVVRAVLDSIDLTELVLERLDLDRVAAGLDVDAVAARIGLDAVLDRVDPTALDALIARVDLDAAVARVDLDAAVANVDLQAVVDRLDVDAVVDRVDLGRATGRLDLAPILARVDVDGIAARLDPQKVLDRVDLIGIAQEIVDALDLPAIIRESSGFLASDAVTGLRSRAVYADDAVGSALSRLFPGRRRRARLEHPESEPASEAPPAEAPPVRAAP